MFKLPPRATGAPGVDADVISVISDLENPLSTKIRSIFMRFHIRDQYYLGVKKGIYMRFAYDIITVII